MLVSENNRDIAKEYEALVRKINLGMKSVKERRAIKYMADAVNPQLFAAGCRSLERDRSELVQSFMYLRKTVEDLGTRGRELDPHVADLYAANVREVMIGMRQRYALYLH